jgi:large subunit ribosomal protein L19
MDLRSVSNAQVNPNIPDFGPGDRIKVSAKVVEGDRERIQVFEGDEIRISNAGPASTFTVRKISSGIGVERTFQRHSPRIDKVEVVRRGKVRRARLYYLRGLRGRAARIKEAPRARPAKA